MKQKAISDYTRNLYSNQFKSITHTKQFKYTVIHPTINVKITEFDKIPHEKYRKIVDRRNFWTWEKSSVQNSFTNELVRRFSTLIYLHGNVGKSEIRVATLVQTIKGILRTEPILQWTFKTYRDKRGRTDFFIKQIGLMTKRDVRPFWFSRKISGKIEWTNKKYQEKKMSIQRNQSTTVGSKSSYIYHFNNWRNQCYIQQNLKKQSNPVFKISLFSLKNIFFTNYEAIEVLLKYKISNNLIRKKINNSIIQKKYFEKQSNLFFINWKNLYKSNFRFGKKIIKQNKKIWMLIFMLISYTWFFKLISAFSSRIKINVKKMNVISQFKKKLIQTKKKNYKYKLKHIYFRLQKIQKNIFFSKPQKIIKVNSNQKTWAIALIARSKWRKFKARFILTNKKYDFGQTISPRFCGWPIQSLIGAQTYFWFTYSGTSSTFKRRFAEQREYRPKIAIVEHPKFSIPITKNKPVIYKVAFLRFDYEHYIILKRYYTEPIVDFFIKDIVQIITPPQRLFVYRFRKSNKQKPKLNYISRTIKTSLIKIKLILKWFRTSIVKNKQNERLKQKGNKPKKKVVLLTTKRIYRVKRPFLVLFYRAFKQFITLRGKVITELKKNNFLILRRSYKKHFRWPYRTILH